MKNVLVTCLCLMLSVIGSTALAGPVKGFKFPVETYANDGLPNDYKLTAANLGAPVETITINAILPRYEMLQLKIGTKFYNVRIRDVVLENPARYTNLGNGIKPICVGANTRIAQSDLTTSYATRGAGVENLC